MAVGHVHVSHKGASMCNNPCQVNRSETSIPYPLYQTRLPGKLDTPRPRALGMRAGSARLTLSRTLSLPFDAPSAPFIRSPGVRLVWARPGEADTSDGEARAHDKRPRLGLRSRLALETRGADPSATQRRRHGPVLWGAARQKFAFCLHEKETPRIHLVGEGSCHPIGREAWTETPARPVWRDAGKPGPHTPARPR